MTHWIILANGAEHHLTGAGLATNDHDITAIAHQLAIVNRFTGATRRPYSVAEHSLLCADIARHVGAPAHVQLACLLHDAHESITGDMSSPVKWTVGAAWEEFEAVHARALRRHFGALTTFAGYRLQIKQIDLVALATERRDLMPWSSSTHRPWPVIDTPGMQVPPADWVNLGSLKREQTHWSEWRDQLLEQFHALRAEVDAGVDALRGAGMEQAL